VIVGATDQFLGLDAGALREPVRRALGSTTADVQSWEVQALGNVNNQVTGSIQRVRGTALTAGVPVSCSVVLKACRDPGQRQHHDVRAPNYWKREFLAYASGLIADLPPGVRAPRCYGVEERPDGHAWLWLEDLTEAYGTPWPLERYALAARLAGQLNGAYLAGRPIPDLPWLSFRAGLSFFDQFGPHLERTYALGDHPLVRREWPVADLIDRSVRLWRERDTFYGALARLPQTLCHLDFFRLNLFAVRSPEGADETVGVDWAFLGPAAVGEELAPLVWASPVLAGEHAQQARELGEACFEGYLAGLRDAGWRGDARLARLGYAAGVIRYGGTITPTAIDDPAFMTSIERAWGPFGDILDRWAAVRPYMLDLADEARELMSPI
jgi:hypothetical protein